jgi:hypothetical protein
MLHGWQTGKCLHCVLLGQDPLYGTPCSPPAHTCPVKPAIWNTLLSPCTHLLGQNPLYGTPRSPPAHSTARHSEMLLRFLKVIFISLLYVCLVHFVSPHKVRCQSDCRQCWVKQERNDSPSVLSIFCHPVTGLEGPRGGVEV